MNLRSIDLYRQDLDRALSKHNLLFLKNRSILITGGTGLIGSSIIDLILESNHQLGNNTKVLIASRNEQNVKERFGQDNNIVFLKYDALQPIDFQNKSDFIIHCAGIASPDLYVSNAVETMLTNFYALDNLLKYARDFDCGKVLYVSSSEVYGKKTTDDPFSEEDYGYLDILATRSSYSSAKRASETLCKAYYEEYGVKATIVRPGHVFGPTASLRDKRVSSQFAYLAARGEGLQLKSSGLQIRSYMYCVDCATAILTVLEKGIPCEAYNICGSEVASIKEMAQFYANAGNVELKYERPTEAELSAFNPMSNSTLAGEKLFNLGFTTQFPLEKGFSHTVSILKNMLEEK